MIYCTAESKCLICNRMKIMSLIRSVIQLPVALNHELKLLQPTNHLCIPSSPAGLIWLLQKPRFPRYLFNSLTASFVCISTYLTLYHFLFKLVYYEKKKTTKLNSPRIHLLLHQVKHHASWKLAEAAEV